MGIWSWLRNGAPSFEGAVPNDNGPLDYNPGDPGGVSFDHAETFSRSLPFPVPSPWSGWPQEWDTPYYASSGGLSKLIDTAWNCLDLNATVLSTMPVYRTRNGAPINATSWMTNPDPSIYTSWTEFAKQLFWDYMMGEAFVLSYARQSDGYPARFRVIPPWLVQVEMRGGRRVYELAGEDVTSEILHIRYQSSTTDARGHGPLEMAGERMVAAGMLQRYAQNLVQTGGTPHYVLEVPAVGPLAGKKLSPMEAEELLTTWIESRTRHPGHPAVLSGGVQLRDVKSMSAKDMTLLELSQFYEARIAVALGVPPFLVGLPAGGDSLTYSTVAQLFDFHDRASLRPKAAAVMAALSGWLLPAGQMCELNRDEYSRPDFVARAGAWEKLIQVGAVTVDEFRAAERFNGASSAVSLSGGEDS